MVTSHPRYEACNDYKGITRVASNHYTAITSSGVKQRTVGVLKTADSWGVKQRTAVASNVLCNDYKPVTSPNTQHITSPLQAHKVRSSTELPPLLQQLSLVQHEGDGTSPRP